MPKLGVFTLKGPHEGKSMTILDKYPFVDGVFKTQASHAPLMARMLCEYYGAELVYEGTDEAPAEDGEDGSLAISSTRGLTEGQKMENQDMAAKLQYAADQAAEAKKLAAKKVTEGEVTAKAETAKK